MSGQVVMPWASEVDPGAQLTSLVLPLTASSTLEQVTYKIPQGQQYITVPFTVNKASGSYLLLGINFSNVVDSTVISNLTFTITNRATNGVTGLLSAPVDTANYNVSFIVIVYA